MAFQFPARGENPPGNGGFGASQRPGGFGILMTRNMADELLYNQRGSILGAALRLRTKALVASLGFPID